MCKVKGHSIFTYIAQPHNTTKLLNSKKQAANIAKKQAELEQINKAVPNSALNSDTVTSIRPNEANKNRLGSLRIPLKTNMIGANNLNETRIGLNLGG